MKKIAIIFPKDSEAVFNRHCRETFGGATVQLYLIAKELSTYKNIEVYSFINSYDHIEFEDQNKFNLVKTYKRRDNSLIKIIKFYRRIRQIRPDIIIQRGLSPFSCLMALFCRIIGIDFIFMFAHDREVLGRYQKTNNKCPLFTMLLNHAALLIFQSEDQLRRVNGNHLSKCRLIFSGNEIRPLNEEKKEFILWVGRMEKWKQPELFIELAKKHSTRKFVMISPPVDGQNGYYHSIVKEAGRLKNLQLINFVGFREVDSYFEKARLFVNTSTEEGFPNTFIQACKSKTPILSLNVNPGNFINKYNCGLVCENSFTVLSEKLDYILKNEKLYDEMAECAYRNSWENHNIKTNVKKLLETILITPNN